MKKICRMVIVVCLAIYGFAFVLSQPVMAQKATSTETRKVSVGSFLIDIPLEWTEFTTSETAELRNQYLEQSKQIYQYYSGTDDPTKSVNIAAFNIFSGKGSFIIVCLSIPPQSNLIQMLKDQVGDKMNYGIQQGFIQKYIGLVSVDKALFAGFYTKAIGRSGNLELSGGLEHRDMKNTIIQLTFLAPKGWDEEESTTALEAVLKSVKLKED